MREMKDSGIEWIGEIPKEWKTSKLKYLTTERSESALMTSEDIYIGLENVASNKNEVVEIQTENLQSIQNICKKDDVLFSKLRPYLNKVIICPCDCFCTSEFIVYKCFEGDNRYLRYFLTNAAFIDVVTASTYGTKMPRANPQFIKNLEICYCDLAEQQQIADYLDTKCSEIDATAEDIQKEISLLEDYKKSVITEAVTKGLNPDAEMKDSGIEWIGEVPKHWGTIRIGNAFSIRNERNYLPMEQVQLLSLYSGKGVFPTGEEGTTNRGNHAQTVADYKIVKKNDIVVNIILAWMGSLGISNYNGVVSPAYDVYIPNEEKVVPHYYHYVFRTSGIANECYRYGRGIMMMRWRTYSSEFKRIHVPFPPLEEQQQIADYLDTKCSEIDAIIADKKRQRGILTEYKKSLIYEYVTGKKEVPVHE